MEIIRSFQGSNTPQNGHFNTSDGNFLEFSAILAPFSPLQDFNKFKKIC